jgi:nucleotide-binding universal stress UspA family protein
MNKRILVPLDGSKLAEMALPHAAAFALANGYGLTLLRVCPLPAPMSPTVWGVAPSTNVVEGWDEELNRGKQYLEGVAERIARKGLDVRTALTEGEPALSIIAYAERYPDVALIAMSTHGRSGLSWWVFGSVAEKVLHASPVPLLLVHCRHEQEVLEKFQVPEYRSLLIPLDGSVFAAQALDMAKSLAATLHTSMILLSAVSEGSITGMSAAGAVATPATLLEWNDESEMLTSYLQRNRQDLEAEGFTVDARLEYGPPAEAILRAADSADVDLIVMATHGRTGLPRLWLGSVAMKVVQASTLPVLLVRAKERVKESEAEPERTGVAMALAPAI